MLFLEESHFDLILDTGIETVILQRKILRKIILSFTILYKKILLVVKSKLIEYIYRQLRGAEPPDEETA